MIKLGTARRLKELGLELELEVGDKFYIWHQEQDRWVGPWTYGGENITRPHVKAPSLEQLMEEVKRRLPEALISFYPIHNDGRHCSILPAVRVSGQPSYSYWGDGPDDTEALAQALVKIEEVE